MIKEVLKRLVLGSMFGIAISYLITIGISMCINDGNYYACVPALIEETGSMLSAVILQTILSAILGAGFAGSSIIWEIEKWSILKQTSIYFAIVTAFMMPIAYTLQWMKRSLSGVLSYFAVFVGIFVIVWLTQYFGWKSKIKKMNEQLNVKE